MTAHMVTGPGRWVRWIGAPIAVAGVITLAACGSGTASTSGTAATGSGSSGSGSSAANTAMDAFASCMSQNGVTMPAQGQGGPGGGGTPPTGAPPAGGAQGGTPPTGAPDAGGGANQAPPGVDATTWAAAQKACASLAPTPPGGAQGS